MRVLLCSPSHSNQYRSRHLRDLIRLISCTLPLLSHPFQHPLYPESFPIPYLYPSISTSSSIPAHSLLPFNSSPRHLPLAQYQPTLSVIDFERDYGSANDQRRQQRGSGNLVRDKGGFKRCRTTSEIEKRGLVASLESLVAMFHRGRDRYGCIGLRAEVGSTNAERN